MARRGVCLSLLCIRLGSRQKHERRWRTRQQDLQRAGAHETSADSRVVLSGTRCEVVAPLRAGVSVLTGTVPATTGGMS